MARLDFMSRWELAQGVYIFLCVVLSVFFLFSLIVLYYPMGKGRVRGVDGGRKGVKSFRVQFFLREGIGPASIFGRVGIGPAWVTTEGENRGTVTAEGPLTFQWGLLSESSSFP